MLLSSNGEDVRVDVMYSREPQYPHQVATSI